LSDGLPSDPAELRVFAAALLDRCAKLGRLLSLQRIRSSVDPRDADQLQLVLEDIEGVVADLEATEDRANPRANRGRMPEHLPRIVDTLMPAATCCPCCAGVLFEIGSDDS
jgi:transposase